MGKWEANQMNFAQLWNNDCYEPEKRNYSRIMMIFRTPDYKSWGDENGGSDNERDESIYLTVNIEEGKVFLEDYAQAKKILTNDTEIARLIHNAQKKFDNEFDMGRGTHFIYGWGGRMASLYEYENPNIEYIPIIFPDTEKFRISNYREKVEWSLIEKGAIMIVPQKGKMYLAVIQRKNKKRDLKPFLRYISQNVFPKEVINCNDLSPSIYKLEPKISPELIDLDSIKEAISKMTIKEMYSKSNFEICQNIDDVEEGIEVEGNNGDGKWYVFMSSCKLGGCDYDGVSYKTEREALEAAVFLSFQGKEPHIGACPTCYQEYMNDCI